MPERAQVPRRRGRRRAFVDRHERVPLEARAALHDHRQPPSQHGLDERVAVGHRVQDERVDGRVQHERGVALLARRRYELQCDPRRGQAAEELDRRRVLEGVHQRLAQHHAEHARPAAPERARQRVRPRVAQLVGLGQDPLAQLGRELLRPVVGVGHRHRRDAQRLGDGGQRDPRRRQTTSALARGVQQPRLADGARALDGDHLALARAGTRERGVKRRKLLLPLRSSVPCTKALILGSRRAL